MVDNLGTISSFNTLAPIIIQQYESYLPNAFDDSLSMLQKVNIIIQNINSSNTTVNSLITQWNNDIVPYVNGDGFQTDVDNKLNTMASDGTLASLISNDYLGIGVDPIVKGAKGDGITDDTSVIQGILNGFTNGGVLLIPKGYTFLISSPLNLSLEGVTVKGGGKILKKAIANCRSFYITADNVIIDGVEIDGNRTNQTLLNYSNDEIYLSSVKNCTIQNCNIHDSAGDGIVVSQSSRNKILNNIITNVHDNGIMVSDLGADYNLIQGNIIDTTTSQDGIFLTASSGSTTTTNNIYGNEVSSNWVFNVGDTGIETGIRAVGSIIKSNHVISSTNGAILIRENQYAIIEGNEVDQSKAPSGGNPDGIDFLSQLTDSNHIADSYCICRGNSIRGSSRYGVYIQGHNNILIDGNQLNNNAFGVYVSGSFHKVINNKINGCNTGITLDESGTDNCDSANIDNNEIIGSTNGITAYNKTLSNVVIRNNRLINTLTNTVHAQGSTATNSFSYGNIATGGGSPTNADIFIKEKDGINGNVPLNQYDSVILAQPNDTGLLVVKFGSNKYAFCYINNGSVVVANSSSDIANNLSGFAGWGIGVNNAYEIILQRRGYTLDPANWQPNTAYSSGAYIQSGGVVYECTTAGTSGATAPTFNTASGGTTTDNTVTWTEQGSSSSAMNFLTSLYNV